MLVIEAARGQKSQYRNLKRIRTGLTTTLRIGPLIFLYIPHLTFNQYGTRLLKEGAIQERLRLKAQINLRHEQMAKDAMKG